MFLEALTINLVQVCCSDWLYLRPEFLIESDCTYAIASGCYGF